MLRCGPIAPKGLCVKGLLRDERVVVLKRGLWDAMLFLPVLDWPLTRPGFSPASSTMPSCHSVLSGQMISNFQNNTKHLTKNFTRLDFS